MEEWLFLYRVTLDRAYIAPGYIQGSTPVVTNFADSGLAIWDLATMSAGKTDRCAGLPLSKILMNCSFESLVNLSSLESCCWALRCNNL